MNRTAWLFAAATAAAAVALIPSGAAGWIPFAAAAAFGAAALSRGLPRGWGLRSAFLLLGAYIVLLGWFRLESWNLARGGGEAAAELEESKRQRVAEVFARRLEDDRALLEATVAALERLHVTASGPDADAGLFRALDRASPPALPAGIGFEVYDREGRMRAWWGDPRGDRLPPDSVAGATLRPLVRAPSGYRMAYVAAPWIAAGDTFVFALKDLWAAESPLRREVAEPELLVPRLEAIHDLEFHVAGDWPQVVCAQVETVLRRVGQGIARRVELKGLGRLGASVRSRNLRSRFGRRFRPDRGESNRMLPVSTTLMPGKARARVGWTAPPRLRLSSGADARDHPRG